MKSQKNLLLILLLMSLAQLSLGKGYSIPSNIFYLDASSSAYNMIQGGDTLYFEAGNRDYLCLLNFKGNASSPIVMINHGGDVIIDTDHYYGIAVKNCQFIKLTGTGYPGMMYGFKVKRVANGAGMSFCELSSDFEAEHISIENTLIGGLYAKTDPDGTPATDRAHFTQYNTIIHDNFISHSGDEGMYIGSTKFAGQTVNVNGVDSLCYPSILDGVKVYNNIVEYAGWDGIQVSSASKNCQIYNNTIRFDSQQGLDTQMSGIILGGGTKADCFNNYIADGKGVGIEIHGLGGCRVFNNIIVNPGLTYFPGDVSWPKHGMYISDNSVQQDSSFYIFNNTIINPKSDGIRFASAKSKNNLISSNVIINPGSFTYYETGNTSWRGIDSYVMAPNGLGNLTISNNYFQRDALLAGFASPNLHDASDFKLTSGSPLIDAADTNPKASASFDFLNNPRPSGLRSDIGAYEFIGTSITFTGGIIAADQTINAGNPTAPLTNSVPPGGYSGTLEYKWQSSISSATGGFTDIPSTNSAGYAPGIISSTTWFRRVARVTSMTDWTKAVFSNAVKITINLQPAAVAGTNRSICLNSSTQIGAAAVAGSTYSWISSPAGFTSTLANPTVIPKVTTTYTLTEKITATGTSNSHSVVVTVNPVPVVMAIGGTNTICLGSKTTLTDATAGGIWSSETTSVATISSSGAATGTGAGTAAILYTITNSYGCTSKAVTTLTVNAPASQPGDFTTFSSSVKLGDDNVVYTVPYVAGVSYRWTYSGDGVTIRATNNSVKLSFSKRATPGTLSVTATNSCGTSLPRSIKISMLKDAILTTESAIPVSMEIPALMNTLNVYPNPTTGSATFDFQIGEDARVTLSILSVTGQVVAKLFDEKITAGSSHTIHFNQSLPPQIYPCVLQWNGQRILVKLIVKK